MSEAVAMIDREEEEAFTADVPTLPVEEGGKYIWEKHYPDGIDYNAKIEQKPLFEILDKTVRDYGQSTALDFLGKTYSYAEVGAAVDRVAKGLQDLGVEKGKKIGLFLPNTPYSFIFYYGILKAGATVVNYNPLYAENELIHQVEDSDTDIMITLDLKVLYDKAHKLLQETRLERVIVCPMAGVLPFPKNFLFPVLKSKEVANISYGDTVLRYADLVKNDGDYTPVAVDVEDTAVLQYTGGTTGVSKGAMLTHASIYSNVHQAAHWMHNAEYGKEVHIGVIPLFHVFAMTVVMHLSVWYGMKVILLPKFDPDQVLDMVRKHKPSFFPAVPAIFNALANHPKVTDYDFSSLKFCLTGGAPMPEDTRRLFAEKTGTNVVGEGYGLTETSPIATCNPVAGGTIKDGSVGMPLPSTVIKIVSREDRKTALQTGQKGEVCISGPQLMKGYYKREDATAESIVDGYLHTGDVGYLDEEGYLYLVDRIKDLILVRGYNVYPRHVEEAIYQHPAVEECIVAGVPDEERGETVWAWIKPVDADGHLTQEKLLAFLDDKLSPIEKPRKVIISDEPLPKTAVGKLSRKDLLIKEGIKKA